VVRRVLRDADHGYNGRLPGSSPAEPGRPPVQLRVDLRRAGADIVFSPYSMAGQKLAQSLVRPHVVQFLDFAAESMGLDVMIEQFRVDEWATVVSRTLRDLMLRNNAGVMVLAVRKPDGNMVFNPPADTRIAAGDFLIAMGRQTDLRALDELLASRAGAQGLPVAPGPEA